MPVDDVRAFTFSLFCLEMMIKRCAFVAFLLTLMTSSSAYAVSDERKAELEAGKQAADQILHDDSFYRQWSAEGAIRTLEMAEKVKDEAKALREKIDRALDDRRAWCNTRFFVNACLDESRKLSFTRDREIRQILIAAEDVLRAERTRRITEKVNEQRADRPEPLKIGKPHLKAPAEPMSIGKRPAALPESEPVGHVGKTADDVRDSHEKARQAREQEAANIAAFEKKQREAAQRMAEAESKAAERRASREEHREQFQKKMQERLEAQERYERKQQEKESGLKKYF